MHFLLTFFKLKFFDYDFTVCKLTDVAELKPRGEIYFIGKTDEEFSLVCETENVSENTLEREDGWRAFRIEGVLDFSLTGILSKVSAVLAENKIGIFAVSTYNTDYILVKSENVEKAKKALSDSGYEII